METKDKYALMQEELELEASSRHEGYEVLLRQMQQAEELGMVDTSTKVGQAFFKHKVLALRSAIYEWLEKNMKPKAGVKPNYIFLLEDMKEAFTDDTGAVDLHTIANICAASTMSAILNAITVPLGESSYLVNVGDKTGKGIYYEFICQSFQNWLKTQDKNTKALVGLEKRVGEHYRRIYLKQAIQKCGYTAPSWDKQAAAIRTLGTALVSLAEDTTGYYTLEGNKTTPMSLIPTPQFVEAWQRNEDNMLDKARRYCPMIVPPAAWKSYDDGGYYGELTQFSSLLRLKYTDTIFGKQYLRRLNQLDMPDVYKAVNALQATAWVINKEVLEVMKLCREQGYIPCSSENSNVLSLYDTGAPLKPASTATEEEIKEYKKKAVIYYKTEKRRMSLQNRANGTINTADKYSKYQHIYFPWNMDFRGRMYPIPSFSPQGDDLTKGLLLFADTPPCQHEEDIKWLAITGANLAGVDKVSYDDRITWVYQHEEDILASAADPMGHQWWLQQDEPVQMLAFCFEWAKAKQWIAEHGSIVGWVTGLPYAQDGTCSGLQHFSAILRDPIGGKAVNLVPQDKPNDIYAQVAEKVNEFLKKDAMNGTLDEWNDEKMRLDYGTKTKAQIWLNYGVNRKVTKRPTMTLAYGAKKAGYTEQIMEDTIKKAMREHPDDCVFTQQNCYQCAQYMAGLIWDAVGQTVVKAVEGMDWLHKCAKLVTKNSNVVSWTTPLGLLLQQSYVKYEIEIVKLRCSGKRFRIYTPHQTGQIDKLKQTNGIAPNFIHSMDACHLQMTLCAAEDAGIKHFAMIHDSYGSPISQAQLMYDIVREQFVKMYTEHDVLSDFRECLQPLVEKPLPTPPEKDTLDLNIVKDSKYIFC